MNPPMQVPLLVASSPATATAPGWRWCPRWGDTNQMPSHAQMVQNLLDARNVLGMAREDADRRYEKKRAQVMALAAQGKNVEAWQSMQTAKQYQQRAQRLHGMAEEVERIQSTLVMQKQTASLFSLFTDANSALEHMIKAAPLENVEEVLDSLREHVHSVDEVSTSLAQGNAPTIDEDELEAFCRPQLQQQQQVTPASTTKQQPAQVKMMVME